MGYQSHRCQWGVLRSLPSPPSSGLIPWLPLGSLSWLDTCLGCRRMLAWLTSQQIQECALG